MTVILVSWDPDAVVASVGPGKRHGRSNSLKWPWLYDKLRAKGYDKSKAAAISNSRLRFRKKGRISVLDAKTAHKASTLKKIAAADKAGRHFTKGSLRASAHVASLAFACNDKSCAPPPVGTGGSKKSGGGAAALARRAYDNGYKAGQSVSYDALGRADQRGVRPEWYLGFQDAEGGHPKGKSLPKGGVEQAPKTFKVITADQARGDSRPVSEEEFQRLANIGQKQLDEYARQSSPTHGLNLHWDRIKEETFVEVQQSWGGATISAFSGKALPQGANLYAITVKGTHDTVSVPENATREQFNAAMDEAKTRFGEILTRQQHYLGVFHDDANGRIDIDPVLVVSKSKDVETIGAASHSIGGAYNFKDGLGYWPPHVDTSPTATRKRDDYQRTYEA